MRKLCAALFLGMLALSACNKLPKETHKGKNTFGCRVDGKVWNTYTEHWLDRAVEPEYQTGYLTIQAERDTRTGGGRFYLQLADSLDLRKRTYNAADDQFNASYTSSDDNGDLYILDTTDASSTITITHFEPPAAPDEHAIVSGIFSFTVTSPNTGKKIVVTDGRFDVRAR